MSLIPKRSRKGQKSKKPKFSARPGVEAKKAKEAEAAARAHRRSTVIWTTVFVVGVAGLAAVGFAMNVFNPDKYPSPENHAADNVGQSPAPDPSENGAG